MLQPIAENWKLRRDDYLDEQEEKTMIQLKDRTENHVRIYFKKTRSPIISAMIPQTADTVERALEDYRKTQLPGATSYGRTIYVENAYVGDIWCYCIDPEDTPNAMLSYCIFEQEYWNKGIATEALGQFLQESIPRFHLKTVGAFAYCSNMASIRVLEKQGFRQMEKFMEDGMESVYCQWEK